MQVEQPVINASPLIFLASVNGLEWIAKLASSPATSFRTASGTVTGLEASFAIHSRPFTLAKKISGDALMTGCSTCTLDFLAQFLNRYLAGRHFAAKQFVEKIGAADAQHFRCF